MNVASAYIMKIMLQGRWGKKPCDHQQVQFVDDPALKPEDQFWFCLACGQDVPGPAPNPVPTQVEPEPAPENTAPRKP